MADSCPWHLSEFRHSFGLAFAATHPIQAALGDHPRIRGGYYAEDSSVPFKGNLLFLEGFADSFLNHAPLFEQLSRAGYRVVVFDFMGQGGSGGSMENTRIASPWSQLKIASIADQAWDLYRRKEGEFANRKILLAWSTGGMAAYEMARRKDADAVILIAPAIAPALIVGDQMRVTIDTMTQVDYSNPAVSNPHVDGITPLSPLLVPGFAANIQATGLLARHWKIPAEIPGVVLLTGKLDRYIIPEQVRKAIRSNAPQFGIVDFPDSMHEVDNELPSIQAKAFATILDFLKTL